MADGREKKVIENQRSYSGHENRDAEPPQSRGNKDREKIGQNNSRYGEPSFVAKEQRDQREGQQTRGIAAKRS
jgi:hypothetical protein